MLTCLSLINSLLVSKFYHDLITWGTSTFCFTNTTQTQILGTGTITCWSVKVFQKQLSSVSVRVSAVLFHTGIVNLTQIHVCKVQGFLCHLPIMTCSTCLLKVMSDDGPQCITLLILWQSKPMPNTIVATTTQSVLWQSGRDWKMLLTDGWVHDENISMSGSIHKHVNTPT